MRYQVLIVLVTLVSFAAVSTATAVCIGIFWPRLEASFARIPAGGRARRLVALRLVPIVLALLACGVTMLAFLRHEPADTRETPGLFVVVGAAIGAGLLVTGLWRLTTRCRATNRFLRIVERTATRVTALGVPVPIWQVDTAFPLVALAGIWRPSLLIARSVLEQIPRDELQVILEHELAHARRHDNAVRLLLSGLPDVLNLVRPGIERAWHETAEEVADQMAAGDDARLRVHLASALVRVAKMAGTQAAPALPVLAFHNGESVERRVRRLLNRPEPRATVSSLPIAVMAAVLLSAGVGLWLGADTVLLEAHRAIEWMVNARL